MPEPHAKIGLSSDVNLDSATTEVLMERALERGLPHVRIEDWPTSGRDLAGLGETALRVAAPSREHVLIERERALLAVSIFSGHVHATVAAPDLEQIVEAFTWLRRVLPPPDPSSTHEVTVTFWTYGPHGPQPNWRSIAVPGWDEINENYGAVTRAGLEPLMAGFQPARGGQLILWHGSAGTGKTYALRALAWEWRDWCEFHYIVDPDSFFGEHADYLMNVLLMPTHGLVLPSVQLMSVTGGAIHTYGDEGDGEGPEERAWKLLMLEDTGELLTPDAKSVIGQGLSCFLNVVDGLIGQGLRVLVLVTTNEEIKTLHPAVARPGRCAADIEFDPLSPEEASEWLASRGATESVSRPTTIASLYATLQGGTASGPLPSIGFDA